MACANPPNPDNITPPTELRHPEALSAAEVIRGLTEMVRDYPAGAKIQMAFERAQFELEKAQKAFVPAGEIARLEELVRSLKGEAHRDLRDALPPNPMFGKTTAASKFNVATTIKALESSDHWASKEYRANLIATIERNGRIPKEYKEQLHKDVADVLKICPQAGGLVRELTLRGQRGATGSASKLGSNSNAAIGAAYEVMGTAALIDKVSRPVNAGAPTLYISKIKDHVAFGPKSYTEGRSEDGVHWQPSPRRTVESDVHIGRPELDGWREIGIDFKHTKEMARKYATEDLKKQVEGVVDVLSTGVLHEYHFVTNGTFAQSFRDVIADANAELTKRGATLIGLHEYVSTLVDDPTAKPNAS